jgi:hypothetical protein
MQYQKLIVSLSLMLFALSSTATQAPQETRTEIEALLNKLQAANCQFNRNGTWYSGVEAKVHLTKKLAYFENKNMITSTEDFITHAASISSSSGKAYLVKCGNTQATESKIWLQGQLKIMRSPK